MKTTRVPLSGEAESRDELFASTRWTMVLEAGDSATASAHALSALSELCQIYWRPLYAFLRRQGYGSEDAQDLTQGFFAHLIETRAYARADREKGRFRSFLLGALKHFIADARDRGQAFKRGGGMILVKLDDRAIAEAEAQIARAAKWQADDVYDHEWAASLLRQALDRLAQECALAGKAEQFEHSALDVRSDIYSLGITLWFALTGKTPFGGHSVEEIRRAQQSNALPIEQLKAAHVPFRVRSLLESMLALEPAARPGTQDLAARLRRCSAQANGMRRTRVALAAAVILVLGVSAFFPRLRDSLRTQNSASNPAVPAKSIAVLPFSNLSKEKENAYFADGVQGEILTDLGRIGDLKVISRTSVMQYRSGVARNLREIGQQLGVAHVVEGRVQRTGNRVRVSAQLVDARTDGQLWGQTYDRDLADVFAIQSEIAKAIADQLQAKLSPSEKSAIERPPTSDITAFDLYIRAKNLVLTTSFSVSARPNLLQAADLLNQAVAHDPSFFQAYCQLAYAHDALYFFGYDHTPARLAMAEAAIQVAFRLRPDAGEAHLARAENLYRGYLDYEGALAELEIADQTLPNDARIFELMGYIQRRQGRWEESTRTFERAVDLDPRNTRTLQEIAISYDLLRRYRDEAATLDRALAVESKDTDTKVSRAFVEFDWKADTRPLHQLIDSIRATNSTAVQSIANACLSCALAERDVDAATDALIAAGENPINLGRDVFFNRPFVEGVIARMANDEKRARSAFAAARAEHQKIVQTQPNFGPALCVLGLIDAGLGRKDEALHEGRRAVALLPAEKDAINGPLMVAYLAMIAAWVGEKDLACEQLATVIQPPSSLSYGHLKLMPFWDPLRGDPRFDKIVASIAPK